jgi:uncharacterized repeat protein (TIGR04138 family)
MGKRPGKSPAPAPREAMDLETAIRRLVLPKDARYKIAAYLFLYEALAYTQKKLGRDNPAMKPVERHLTGQELLEGIRSYAHQSFGPLAPTVFRSWGVNNTADFGEIVFNLVENDLLGKTDEDKRADFANGFDFDTAFEGPPESEPEADGD